MCKQRGRLWEALQGPEGSALSDSNVHKLKKADQKLPKPPLAGRKTPHNGLSNVALQAGMLPLEFRIYLGLAVSDLIHVIVMPCFLNQQAAGRPVGPRESVPILHRALHFNLEGHEV